jgi:hypothetical protein
MAVCLSVCVCRQVCEGTCKEDVNVLLYSFENIDLEV